MAQKQQSNHQDNEIEIEDYEDSYSDKFQVFNHQILVMDVMRKALEAGCHEMKAGWFNVKTDNMGNTIRTYIEDTRLKYVGTIKSAIAVMTCDFDDEAEKNIKEYEDNLDELKKALLNQQWKWWQSLTPKYKMIYAEKGEDIKAFNSFNSDLGWWQMYVEQEVECYRNIFIELGQLSRRLDFYQIEMFTA